jgi:pimeloyl-ACP methyl ester carboxylesterase
VAVLTGGVSLTVPAEAHSTKPTIVLVHGAWADSTSWDKVTRQLKDDGYRTVTPKLGLNSVVEDVAIVRTALNKISGRKVLVSHSYGGIVTAGASHGRTDISAFVYAAALVPDEGDSIASLGADFIPSEAFGHLIFTGDPFASPAFIDPAFFHQYFAQDLSKRQAAVLNAAQRPLNFSIVGTPSGPVGWHNVPSWYAVSGQDRMIDPAEERSMAAHVGATVVEFPTASHVGGITRLASRFTALIEHAVNSTRVR